SSDLPPRQPTPLDQDGLLGLFTADETGADYVLTPALPEDMCDPSIINKPSLEVIYDSV
ncbi:MAG: chlorophyllide reductase iron protein subunit X, partial [Pseudomonadota bacterium]